MVRVVGTEVVGMNGEINVVALVRGEEQYIFMFDNANRTETLRMLGRYAADPELSMTWYDAAVLSQKVREMAPAKSTQSAPDRCRDAERLPWLRPPAY